MTCDPPYTVKADGADQTVSGYPGFDTINVRVIDDHTVEIVYKKAGRVTGNQKTTVSADGATARTEFTDYPPSSDKPVTGSYTENRVGQPVANMHPYSGSWASGKADLSQGSLNDNA